MEKHTTKTNLFGAVLVFATVLLASLPASGQYESFFGKESWEYATGYHPIMGTADYDPYLFGCLTNTFLFTSSDTVTIDGVAYHNSSAIGLWPPPVKLREDTLYGRLYSLIEDKEYMVCDMSLQIGDTFRMPVLRYYDYMPEDTVLLLVDSVTFVTSKKVIHLSDVSQELSYWWPFIDDFDTPYNISLRFMEGIGPMYGIIPPHKLGDILFCLKKDDTLYYMTHPDLGCWQDINAIPDHLAQTMTVFPNPANNRVTIRFETEGEIQGHIVIRDIVGRVCLQTTVSKPIIHLYIGHLCKGAYLVTYNDCNNRTITNKIVKK